MISFWERTPHPRFHGWVLLPGEPASVCPENFVSFKEGCKVTHYCMNVCSGPQRKQRSLVARHGTSTIDNDEPRCGMRHRDNTPLGEYFR
ncbi:hypothetical protein J6590_064474 [Homalodisca vitripennis]|nr:hypothetical protein J6590_064474 [Homalodisca vitripennis]